jgi:hypothetical protein
MVFDAHDRAFALFKGTCGRGIYDNMKTAVGRSSQPRCRGSGCWHVAAESGAALSGGRVVGDTLGRTA